MASRNKLSTKIIIMVEVIILISSFLFCLVSVYIARVGIRRAIQQRMLDIANCASGSVDGDFLAKFTEDDIGTPEYQELFKTLNVFKENVELKYVYSIREVSEGNFIFTLDTDPVDPAHYGGSVKYTEALAKAGKQQKDLAELYGVTKQSMSMKFKRDAWFGKDLTRIAEFTGGKLAFIYPDGTTIQFDILGKLL